MAEFEMNKLVRDNIPGKMRAENQAPIYRVVSGRELQRALLEKLKEEADEALAVLDNEAELLGETADIREVVDALVKASGISPTKLSKARSEKRTKRGAFDSGYFVEAITMDDTNEWTEYYRDQPLRYSEILPLSADEDFEVPAMETGVYQHYKGSYYNVLGVGCHTETHEYFVVYQALYKKQSNPDIWIRPYAMFNETIEKDGRIIARFKKV
jgi:predicted house-cleaning noncanonical NTP pyrophosphatase (MazG superfamily)